MGCQSKIDSVTDETLMSLTQATVQKKSAERLLLLVVIMTSATKSCILRLPVDARSLVIGDATRSYFEVRQMVRQVEANLAKEISAETASMVQVIIENTIRDHIAETSFDDGFGQILVMSQALIAALKECEEILIGLGEPGFSAGTLPKLHESHFGFITTIRAKLHYAFRSEKDLVQRIANALSNLSLFSWDEAQIEAKKLEIEKAKICRDTKGKIFVMSTMMNQIKLNVAKMPLELREKVIQAIVEADDKVRQMIRNIKSTFEKEVDSDEWPKGISEPTQDVELSEVKQTLNQALAFAHATMAILYNKRDDFKKINGRGINLNVFMLAMTAVNRLFRLAREKLELKNLDLRSVEGSEEARVFINKFLAMAGVKEIISTHSTV